MSSLGQRIRDFRLKKGITQIELAKGLCTPSMISQIESDRARPSYKILFGIAERLGTTLERLLSNVELGLEQTSQFKMAMAMSLSGNYQAAIPLFEKLAEKTIPNISPLLVQYELAKCYFETGDLENASIRFTNVLDAAKFQQDVELTITVLLDLTKLSVRKKEYQLAKHYGFEALETYQKHQVSDPMLHAKILTQLADLHERTGEVKKAADFYEQGLAVREGTMTLREKANTFLHLADVYRRQGEIEKADKFATTALVAFQEVDDQLALHATRRKLTMLQRDQQNWERSVQELLEIAGWYQQNQDQEQAGETLLDAATVLFENEQLQSAEETVEQAKQLLSVTARGVGRMQRLLADLAFARRDTAKGQKHLDNAIQIFENNGMLAELREVVLALCECLNDQGQHLKAFEHAAKFESYLIDQLSIRGVVL